MMLRSVDQGCRENWFQLIMDSQFQTRWLCAHTTWFGFLMTRQTSRSQRSRLTISRALITWRTSECSNRPSSLGHSACEICEFHARFWKKERKLDWLWARSGRYCADRTKTRRSRLYSSRLYAEPGCAPTWWLRLRRGLRILTWDWSSRPFSRPTTGTIGDTQWQTTACWTKMMTC